MKKRTVLKGSMAFDLQSLWYGCFQYGIDTYTGYNWCNTTVYALGFIAFILVLWKAFVRLQVGADYKLFRAVIPWIALISSLRVLEDFRLLPRSSSPLEWGFYTITPGIYAVGAVVIVGSMLLLKRFSSKGWKSSYEKLGYALLLPFLAFYLAQQSTLLKPPFGVLQIIALAALIPLAFKALLPRVGVKTLDKNENLAVTMAGALDAAATSTALGIYGFTELHVVPNMIINWLGTPYAFLLKIPIVIAALWWLDSSVEREDRELNLYTKMALLVLTLGPGFRDLLLVLTRG